LPSACNEGTVTLENIFYHLEQGKEIELAILDGAQQIVVPAFVTLLVLSVVFAPMFQLSGVAGYLFQPFAESVVFALLASFILSRTLVPTMANYLLRGLSFHNVGHEEYGGERRPVSPSGAIPLSGFRRVLSAISHCSALATGRCSHSRSAALKPSLPAFSAVCSYPWGLRRSSAPCRHAHRSNGAIERSAFYRAHR
jgi:multidrug efflux pump subunit AcrB